MAAGAVLLAVCLTGVAAAPPLSSLASGSAIYPGWGRRWLGRSGSPPNGGDALTVTPKFVLAPSSQGGGARTLLAAARRGPTGVQNIPGTRLPAKEPKDELEREFVSLDQNGDGQLEEQELMFRQYATGCEPVEAQVRGIDYLRCGDLNKDGTISLEEFKSSRHPAWGECVKIVGNSRAHGFVHFIDADTDFDSKLSKMELAVGVLRLWGKPGLELVDPLMGCADTNRDGFMDKAEFHNSIATYNPATRAWQMLSGFPPPVANLHVRRSPIFMQGLRGGRKGGASNGRIRHSAAGSLPEQSKAFLRCMEPAFKKFEAALVFSAADTNGDGKVSQQEAYNTILGVGGATLEQQTADDIFDAADTDKDGFLTLDEFVGAGAAYTGQTELSLFLSDRVRGASALPTGAGFGMNSGCLAVQGRSEGEDEDEDEDGDEHEDGDEDEGRDADADADNEDDDEE